MPHIKPSKDFVNEKNHDVNNTKLKFTNYEEIGIYIYLVVATH